MSAISPVLYPKYIVVMAIITLVKHLEIQDKDLVNMKS